MRYIGDVHGKFSAYLDLTDACDESIQVGDFGVGFGIAAPVAGYLHRFIRGNHDDPQECSEHICYLGDFGMYNGIYFAGGAYSVDRAYRVEGQDWWMNEELTALQMEKAIELYRDTIPEIVVTHQCPMSIETRIFDFPIHYPTRTGQFLNTLMEINAPKLWIFGHYHQARDVNIFGCRFICLGELQYIDIP